jgi:hypothetical protein
MRGPARRRRSKLPINVRTFPHSTPVTNLASVASLPDPARDSEPRQRFRARLPPRPLASVRKGLRPSGVGGGGGHQLLYPGQHVTNPGRPIGDNRPILYCADSTDQAEYICRGHTGDIDELLKEMLAWIDAGTG